MSYFKKFCDLVGGIGAAFAAVYLLGRYMEYNPSDIENKLKLFFSTENAREYRQYLIFIGLLFCAVLVGIVVKKYPVVPLTVSMLALCQVMGMFFTDRIYERAEFYVIVSMVVVAGNIWEAYSLDCESGYKRKQLGVSSSLVALVGVAFSLLSVKFSKMASEMSVKYYESELTEAQTLLKERLSFVSVDLVNDVPEGEAKALIFIAVALAVCLIISLIFRKWSYLNVILAAVPLIYAVSAVHTETLVTSPMLVIVPAAVYLFCRAAFLGKKNI